MKHTECEDCKLRNGDCGHHFKMNGRTNYDIPSLSACDRYGNCEFFQQKERPQGDLISREALKEDFKERNIWNPEIISAIDNAPTVDVISNEEGYEMYGKGYLQGYERGKNVRPQGEWVTTDETDEFYGRVYKCTHCGEEMLACGCRNFCPYCGAEMKGNEE